MSTHAIRLILLLVGAVVAVWAAEPVLGTWTLDVSKSTYKPGPAPTSQTRIYERTSEGIKVTIITTDADGRSNTIEHPANFDGKDYPLTTTGGPYAISLKKVNDYRSEAILKHAGRVIGTAKRAVARDGKTMTVSYQGRDTVGRTVNNVAFYVRQ